LNTKKTLYIVLKIQVLACDIHRNVAQLKQFIGSQSLLIIGSPTAMHIQTINNLHRLAVTKNTMHHHKNE
jgi:hypothetical protein